MQTRTQMLLLTNAKAMKYISLFLFILCSITTIAQTDPPKAEMDSLLIRFLKGVPKERHKEFTKKYKKLNAEEKRQMSAMMDFVFSMPVSSKKQLIENIDSNYSNISALKTYFTTIVPADFSIYIEFVPPDQILNLHGSIDFEAVGKGQNSQDKETNFREWNVGLKSSKLDSLLKLTPLNREHLQELKKYLEKANCISVSNMQEFEIGFVRSGMGKYYYLIFDNPLIKTEQEKYNNGCEYIFYKNNIVLKYGGGAVGPQCFPDKD